MDTQIVYKGQTYEIDADGECFVIKTKRSRFGSQTTYRSRITSERKIRALKKLLPAPVSYAPEVKTSGDTKWVGNGLRFATEDEAKAYLFDLTSRWFAVNEYRVAESSEPVTHKWVNGKLYEPSQDDEEPTVQKGVL